MASRRRLVGAAVAGVVGAVTTGIALGLAIPLARDDDADAATVAVCLLALALALALTVWGFVVLTRATPRWWRLLVVPSLLVAATVTAYVWTIPVLVNVAPPTAKGGREPSDVGLDADEVTLRTDGGARLAAWYVPSGNGAAVVLLHGSGSTRSAVLEHAQALARHGYGVLLVDAHGHGASTGRANLWGWYGDEDVAAAVSYLEQRADGAPLSIALVGLSMGGEEAVGAAATVPGVDAVVAEGVTGRSSDDLAWLADAYGWRGALTRSVKQAQTVLGEAIAAVDRPAPLVQAVRDASVPVLLVVAGRSHDERLAAEALRAAAPDTVTTWEIAGASHAGGLAAAPEEWERRVTDFLARALADD